MQHFRASHLISFQTTIPQFRRPETSVYRRFSDFLGLHEKLVDKYMTQGRIVPPAPEKSVIGNVSSVAVLGPIHTERLRLRRYFSIDVHHH